MLLNVGKTSNNTLTTKQKDDHILVFHFFVIFSEYITYVIISLFKQHNVEIFEINIM